VFDDDETMWLKRDWEMNDGVLDDGEITWEMVFVNFRE
jgi:hypothetical protein